MGTKGTQDLILLWAVGPTLHRAQEYPEVDSLREVLPHSPCFITAVHILAPEALSRSPRRPLILGKPRTPGGAGAISPSLWRRLCRRNLPLHHPEGRRAGG